MKKLVLGVLVLFMATSYLMAAEKMPLEGVEDDRLLKDTQVFIKGGGDKHLAMMWWIPKEYWESVFSRDETISESVKNVVLDTMSGVSLLALVQADVTELGAFEFYGKDEIEKNMGISFSNIDGNRYKISPVKDVESDLATIIQEFKPILGAAMGNLGENMHFYVISDKSKDTARLLDPYRPGKISLELANRDRVLLQGRIELPLDALFVPRKCSNGKDAHISWKYCPWSGKKLED